MHRVQTTALASLAVSIALTACTGAVVPTTPLTPVPTAARATQNIAPPRATSTAVPDASDARPSAVPSATSTPTTVAHDPAVTLLEAGCQEGLARCQDLAPGTYETAGTWAFLRGLTVTLPAAWSSLEQDAGEFELHMATDVNAADEIYFWHDLVAWVDGAPRPALGTSSNELADYLLSDPRLIVSEGPSRTFKVRSPENLLPAGTVDARSFSVILSDAAQTEPDGIYYDCPADACVGFLTDLLHWDGGQAGLTRGDSGCQPECSQAMRLYLADIGPENRPVLRSHTLVVAVSTYGTDPLQALSEWEAEVEPIVESVRVPFIIVDN